MKTGRFQDIRNLANEIARQAEAKKDYVADTRRLTMVPTSADTANPANQVELQGINGGMRLKPIAHAQLADTLKINKAYYDRMLAEAPDLLATNVNRWLASPAKKMIRTLDNQVRAVLTAGYRPLENIDMAEAVLPQVQTLGLEIVSAEMTDARFYLKLLSPRLKGDIKVGDTIQAGGVISNSEVGLGAINVQILDYRLVCTNGMIRESLLRKTHVGRSNKNTDIDEAKEYFTTETRQADDRAFWLKVQDTVKELFNADRFNKRILTYQEAAGMTIPTTADPVEVIEKVSRRFSFSETEQGSVLNHLIRGGDLSKWGLANAITRAAQEDALSYDRANEFERIGGEVIELPASQWREVVAAK